MDSYVKTNHQKNKNCEVDYECSYNINIGIDLKRCIACVYCHDYIYTLRYNITV